MEHPTITPAEPAVTLPDRFDVHVVGLLDDLATSGGITVDPVIIDATAVRHIDHAGIEALTAACGTLKANEHHVVLQPSTTVRVAFELVGQPLPATTPQPVAVLS